MIVSMCVKEREREIENADGLNEANEKLSHLLKLLPNGFFDPAKNEFLELRLVKEASSVFDFHR